MSLTLILLLSIAVSLFSGMAPIICCKRYSFLKKFVHFYLLGLSGIGLVISGLGALLKNLSLIFTISSGNPLLTYSIHLDSLSGFFLCLIGIIIIAIAIYGPSYLQYYEKTKRSINSLAFFTGIFIASMSLVVLANSIFLFILSWELMSLSSYYLVIYHHESPENRQAGFVYLVMAHLSGLFILASFGILARFSGGANFQIMQTAHLTPIWASIAFLFALVGFGIKSGLMPLHVWLPKAHPAAPSHISALMSGVMLKIAIYGFIRFCFTLIGQFHWQWGLLVLAIGSFSAIVSILSAIMQRHLKRLLAYSSIENISIIFIGLGLAMIFISNGYMTLGILGLIASLYHCLNHAIFKSLLFLGAGAVIQHTHTEDLEQMGGLIHKMPYTGFFFLIGAISIAALPPFNGFISEWLLFQTSLQASILNSGIMRIMITVAAATLALTSALAAACFAKVYGIAFLGKPRTPRIESAKKTSLGARTSMGLLALLCLFFGLFPSLTINIINAVPLSLLHAGLSPNNLNHWLWIAPLQVSSYSPVLIFVGLILVAFLIYLFLKPFAHSFLLKQVSAWDCGFGNLTARMKYSSTAFAMPIRRVFNKLWKTEELIFVDQKNNPLITCNKLKYELHLQDWIWQVAYLPLNKVVHRFSKILAKLQGGNIRVYLAYTFFTLLFLLWVIS